MADAFFYGVVLDYNHSGKYSISNKQEFRSVLNVGKFDNNISELKTVVRSNT